MFQRLLPSQVDEHLNIPLFFFFLLREQHYQKSPMKSIQAMEIFYISVH